MATTTTSVIQPKNTLSLAIAQAQSLLNSESKVLTDGRWGSYTNAAFSRASPLLQARVTAVLKEAGSSPTSLYATRVHEKAASVSAIASSTNVEGAMKAASLESGIPLPTLRGFAKIESAYNPAASNGQSRGLFQMQPAAWADAAKTNPAIGKYSTNVFDAVQNSRAAASYMKINMRSLRALGYTGDLSPEVLYLAHQQGAGGFVELWRASKGLTSLTSHVTEESMTRNPPQDGKGKTADKAEFFNRWLTVAKAKMSI